MSQWADLNFPLTTTKSQHWKLGKNSTLLRGRGNFVCVCVSFAPGQGEKRLGVTGMIPNFCISACNLRTAQDAGKQSVCKSCEYTQGHIKKYPPAAAHFQFHQVRSYFSQYQCGIGLVVVQTRNDLQWASQTGNVIKRSNKMSLLTLPAPSGSK